MERLRGHVGNVAAGKSFAFAFTARKAEVGNLERSIRLLREEEEILQLEIAMNNILVVHILGGAQHLLEIFRGGGFAELAIFANAVHDRAARAELEDDVDFAAL